MGEERTFQFTKNVRIFVKKLPKTIANIEDGKQIIKASGSTGANQWSQWTKENIFINHRKVKIIVLVIVILIVEIYLLFGACVLEFKY